MAELSEKELKLSEVLDLSRIVQVKGKKHETLYFIKAIVHNNKFVICTELFNEKAFNERFSIKDITLIKEKVFGEFKLPEVLDILNVHLKGKPYTSKNVTKKLKDTVLGKNSDCSINHFTNAVKYYNYIISKIN
jgi:hypothetical protein